MRGFRFFIIFLAFLALPACKQPQNKYVRTAPPQTNTAVTAPADVTVPWATTAAGTAEDGQEWVPQFELVCAADFCPKQVGLLVFHDPVKNGVVNYNRCTAFLTESNQIMSNGHCAPTSARTGFFITQKINGKAIVRKVKSVPWMTYVPSKTVAAKEGEEPPTSGEMDAAIFELETPISNEEIEPFDLAEGAGADFDKLYAFVINEAAKEDQFQIEMRVCSVKRHESIFPFDLKENPDVIWTFECLTEGGNSGAPMLSSPDSNVVEGIHVGSIRLEKQIEFIKTEEKREPYNYEKHGTEQTTNVRCLPIPGRKNVPECVRTSAEMKSARFTRYQMAKLDERNTRPLPENLRLGFDYSVYAYDLVLPPGEHGYFFEIYYIPKCRPSPELPADVPVRIETLRMEFDEYARLSLKTVEIKTPATRVLKPNANDVYTLESRWPAAPGAFLYPDFPGLREQWGESFSIAIPRCRR